MQIIDMESVEKKIERLRRRGVVLTLQRLAVLKILGKEIHATAEDIYHKLAKKYPTISRATVYSSLDALKHAGEIQELTIKKEMSYFDFNPHNHHHFLCRTCGRIFDVEISCPISRKGRIHGHKVEEVQAYFYGTCRECRQGKKRSGAPMRKRGEK